MSRAATAVLLVLVLALAGALRGVWLERLPPGLYLDEASVGANARSLVETGRDVHGARWPVIFRALEDWKHPIYLYGAAASVKALGPTRLAVRLPAAVFGTATVLLVFLLGRELAGNSRPALVAALVLAITPWHIHYSRMAWEAVTFGLTVVLALWLHFRARRLGGVGRFVLAGAAFGLAVYSYTPAKLLVPAFVAAILALEAAEARGARALAARILHYHETAPAPPVLLETNAPPPLPREPVRRKDAIALVAALLVVAAPMAVAQALHFSEIQTRFNAVSVWNEPSPVAAAFRSYFAHLDPGFLFLRGDANERHSWPAAPEWPNWATLLLATAPFAVLGLVRAVARHETEDLVLLAWLAIYPLGGALTSEGVPHASRSFLAVPLFALLAANGLEVVLARAGGRKGEVVAGVLAVALWLGNAGLAARSYVTQYAPRVAVYWASGVEELVPLLASRPGEVTRIHVAQRTGIVRDHVLYLGGGIDRWSWVSPETNLPRFVMQIPASEVIVCRPAQLGGLKPWLEVRDESGMVAYGVFRGRGR